MENIDDEYKHYWETTMFLQTEEFDSWGLDEAFSGYYDSSSPDGAQSSAASKNIVSERNRRKKLNERLFALRSVVPNISKMDKASIIKDAIDYIQELHEQERRIQAEIVELESGKMKKKNSCCVYDLEEEEEEEMPRLLRSKKKRTTDQSFDSRGSRASSSPFQDLELRVSYMGEKTVVVSVTCSKTRDTMVKLCEAFESLKLKIITANITALSGRLLKTVFVQEITRVLKGALIVGWSLRDGNRWATIIICRQADEEERDILKIKIESAIASLNDPESPVSI